MSDVYSKVYFDNLHLHRVRKKNSVFEWVERFPLGHLISTFSVQAPLSKLFLKIKNKQNKFQTKVDIFKMFDVLHYRTFSPFSTVATVLEMVSWYHSASAPSVSIPLAQALWCHLVIISFICFDLSTIFHRLPDAKIHIKSAILQPKNFNFNLLRINRLS